jgi:hypothetical protein
MKFLSEADVIAMWERGAGQHPADRALTLLAACCGESPAQLALLSLGQRDGRLLKLYAQLYGDKLSAFAECPQCAERLEYELSAHELGASATSTASADALSLAEGDVLLRLRLPNSFDLGAATACADVDAARRLLAERCIVEATRAGEPVVVQQLAESSIERISERLAEADPQAEMLINLTCAGCRHQWQIIFEIESFFWSRISSLARRLLREVHTLARAYGWREHDILSLGPLRRQCYLEMVG